MAPPCKAVRARPSPNAGNLRTRCILVLVAAFISLTIQRKLIPLVGMGRGFESISIAKSLAVNGTFASPFDAPTGPTAHLAPLWPFVLAGIYRAAGSEQSFRVAALSLAILFHLLNALLMFLLARELFQDSLSRYCTVALALIVPLYQLIPAEDAIYVSAGLLAFWLLARRHGIVLCGLFGGLLLLLNPSLLTILTPIVAYEWKRVKAVSAFLAIAFLVVSPWEIRNYHVFHRVFFIRDNLGLELDVYNNDCEVYGTGECIPHPMVSAVERAKMGEMGEASYNAMRLKHALTWFRTHQGAALRLIAGRIGQFWFPVSAAAPYGYGIVLITAASLWGFWRLLRSRLTVVWPMLAILAIYPPVYYLVRFDLRYRYSVLWISILAAGYGIARIIEGSGLPRRLRAHA